MSWSRKNSTLWVRSRARSSATSPASREATPRLTLLNSAPIAQVSGSTLMQERSTPGRTTAGAAGASASVVVVLMAWPLPESSSPGAYSIDRAGLPLAKGGSGRLLEQPEDLGPAHELLAVVGRKLDEQVLQVPLDRLLTHLQRPRDLLVRQITRQELEHLALLRRERHARGG